jgi:signal transduction histidine kinase
MSRALTSQQWFARVTLILAVGASEVAVAAIAGVGGWRMFALGVLGFAFVLSYLVTPSAGKPEYDAHALRPIAVMTGASVAAIAITGGLASPLLALLACPYVLAWTMFRPRRFELLLGLLPLLAVVALWAVTRGLGEEVPSNSLLLGAWTLVVVLWLVGRRVAQQFETLHGMAGCLSRVREGALSDAASRRRGLESMTTKLAHELKNPLAAMKSLLQVELQHAHDPRSQRRLEVVLGESERIGRILREYLELARPVGELDARPVLLGELVTDVTELLGGRAEAAGVKLLVRGEGGRLHADPRLLKEALVNLVCNGIEASPRGGSVTVNYHIAAGGATIAVRDTGSGMSPQVAARVGTPFFTTRQDGTGLGVAIARSAIAQHRGKLDYASTPGTGTTATIALPIDPRNDQEAAA